MNTRYAILAALGLTVSAAAQTILIPDTLTVTNRRQEVECALSGVFFKGSPLLLTNCVLYAAGTNRQAISNVAVIVQMGLAGNYATATGTVQSVTGGVWNARLTVPDVAGNTIALQVKLVDSHTNTFIYPRKMLTVVSPL